MATLGCGRSPALAWHTSLRTGPQRPSSHSAITYALPDRGHLPYRTRRSGRQLLGPDRLWTSSAPAGAAREHANRRRPTARCRSAGTDTRTGTRPPPCTVHGDPGTDQPDAAHHHRVRCARRGGSPNATPWRNHRHPDGRLRPACARGPAGAARHADQCRRHRRRGGVSPARLSRRAPRPAPAGGARGGHATRHRLPHRHRRRATDPRLPGLTVHRREPTPSASISSSSRLLTVV